ncbi:MAG: hypothetical protein MMC33_001847 [Icmadophila ericetorum]|nr:hypothetical protein [Icmadophila ericetorum]
MTKALLALTTLQLQLCCHAAPIAPPNQLPILDNPITNAEDIRAALKQAAVIPDVLPDFLPTHALTLTYPKSDSGSNPAVTLGNILSPSEASDSPAYFIKPLTPPASLSPTLTIPSNVTYTLVLSDPDATSHANPTKGEMCHWILTGIKLVSVNATNAIDTDGYQIRFSESEPELEPEPKSESSLEKRTVILPSELISYMPPGPPPKTGYHRYVFVLLAPVEGEEPPKELSKPKERAHWGYGEKGRGVRNWAGDNGLVPVGANFFYAQNEEQ